MISEAYIYDSVRTPRGRGRNGGALYEVKPVDLLSGLLEDIARRNDLDKSLVEDVIIATNETVGEQAQNIAKTALVYSNWPDEVTGAQLHRYCAGSLDAVNIGSAKVKAGFEDLVISGGVESMSRLSIGSSGSAASDPWVAMKSIGIAQGVAADLIATLDNLSREELDAFALESQNKAAHAQREGYFDKSIVPVKDMNGITILTRDEHVRKTSMDKLAKLAPSFQFFGELGHDELLKLKYPQVETVSHVHTPGNSCGVVDGASLILLGNENVAKQTGMQPRARIVSCALEGSEPTIMLTGPAGASRKALAKAGLTASDIDLFEVNEAFASVILRFQREMDVPMDRINVNGGAIALGHPIGATGAMILGTLLDELERRELRYGLASLCAGGGIGIATIIERIH